MENTISDDALDLDFLKGLLVQQNRQLDTPFHLAAKYGHEDKLKLLGGYALGFGDDYFKALLVQRNGKGYTPFQLAAKNDKENVLIDVLISLCTSSENRTPVLENRRYLLLQREWRDTPFHSAVKNGHENELKSLGRHALAWDDNYFKTLWLQLDGKGNTSYCLAKEHDHEDVFTNVLISLCMSAKNRTPQNLTELPPNEESRVEQPNGKKRKTEQEDIPLTNSKRVCLEQEISINVLKCTVCLDQERCIALMPCAHLCVCATCAKRIEVCPVCRGRYTEKLRIHLP